ncbi:preprotein translocase subunit SecG [Neptunicella sp. SCSIO 80796]|uniref:preprotein translocase subunit SecG n=1 Tax=Neptunicella plasticusilytica TaxID=3117012 RepID=UPI003A4DDB0C
MLYEVLIVVYLIVALLLIGMVLVQQGKGADMGASFGAGGSNTVFGASGSGNFMSRTTAILATLFFVISLILGNLSSSQEKQVDEWQNLESSAVQQIPAEEQPADTDVPASDVPAADPKPENNIPE